MLALFQTYPTLVGNTRFYGNFTIYLILNELRKLTPLFTQNDQPKALLLQAHCGPFGMRKLCFYKLKAMLSQDKSIALTCPNIKITPEKGVYDPKTTKKEGAFALFERFFRALFR